MIRATTTAARSSLLYMCEFLVSTRAENSDQGVVRTRIHDGDYDYEYAPMSSQRALHQATFVRAARAAESSAQRHIAAPHLHRP